uniref:Uncharacterized protein n=1 Tax=Cannabis sativa TaxID=3483 RepID=A0A803P2Q9_CANSA
MAYQETNSFPQSKATFTPRSNPNKAKNIVNDIPEVNDRDLRDIDLNVPTNHHEYPKLELRWAWEPTSYSIPKRHCVQKKPNFLLLCETMCKKDVSDRIKGRLEFDSCFIVEAQGKKGGLALLWKTDNEAHLFGYSDNHIDIEVHISGYARWRLTGFHGEPNRALRDRTWHLLCTILQIAFLGAL